MDGWTTIHAKDKSKVFVCRSHCIRYLEVENAAFSWPISGWASINNAPEESQSELFVGGKHCFMSSCYFALWMLHIQIKWHKTISHIKKKLCPLVNLSKTCSGSFTRHKNGFLWLYKQQQLLFASRTCFLSDSHTHCSFTTVSFLVWRSLESFKWLPTGLLSQLSPAHY